MIASALVPLCLAIVVGLVPLPFSYGPSAALGASKQTRINVWATLRLRRHSPSIVPSGLSSIERLKANDLHMNNTLRHFPIPGPDTTMSEVQSMIESLNQPIEETLDAQDRLKRIATFVDSSNRLSREALVEHGNLVHPYLMEVQKGIGQIRQSLGSPDGQRLSALLEQIVVNLDSLAARVDEATEGLLKI